LNDFLSLNLILSFFLDGNYETKMKPGDD
jgi:hypothetical protein